MKNMDLYLKSAIDSFENWQCLNLNLPKTIKIGDIYVLIPKIDVLLKIYVFSLN